MSKVKNYFIGLSREFKKIVWPSRETLFKEFLIVVVVTFIMGVVIAVFDFGVKYLLDFIFSL